MVNETTKKIDSKDTLKEVLLEDNTGVPYLDFDEENFKDKWNGEKAASALRTDVLRLAQLFERTFFPKWTEAIEHESMSNLRRALWLKKEGKENNSNAKAPIIKTSSERLKKALLKANFHIKAHAINPEDKDKVEAVQAALERCYSTSWARHTLLDSAASGILNGNGYCKATFRTPKERLASIQNIDSKKYIRMTDTYAKLEWVSEFDMFFEPTQPLSDGQRFVIYRWLKPFKSIMKTVEAMDKHVSPEKLNYAVANPKPFISKDYNKIRLIKYYEDIHYVNKNFNIDNIYKISFNNDLCEYCEVWTPDNMLICLNGWIIADMANPLKGRDYRHPYFACHYSKKPGISIADWVGVLLRDIQVGYDAFWNMLQDSAAKMADPMMQVQPGQVITDHAWDDTKIIWKGGHKIQVHWPSAISWLTPPPIDNGTMMTLQNFLEMANYAISPATYSDYKTQSRSAQDSMLRFEGLNDTIAPLAESISEMLNNIAQSWLLDMQTRMPELFEIPVFDSKWRIKSWKKIKSSDLQGKFIFERSSESIRDTNTIIEKTQLPELVNAIQTFWFNDDGTSLVDKQKLLEYVLWLYGVDTEIIKSDRKYYSDLEKDQMNKAEIEVNVQNYVAENTTWAEEQPVSMQDEMQQPMQQNYDDPMQAMMMGL